MANSMTGFGRSQIEADGYLIRCEIRSVNHRYLDPNIRISRRYAQLEEKIKAELKKLLERGRIEISINIDKTEESRRNIKLDKKLAVTYYNYLKDLAESLQISPEIKLIDVFRLPEVFNLSDEEENMDEVWGVLQQCFVSALDNLIAMRKKEGQSLIKDITARLDDIAKMVVILESRAPQVVIEYRDRLRARIGELMQQEQIEEARIIQEVAVFADRSNVTEELVRLNSHIEHLNELITSEQAIGRKGDFLLQEMFREINTVASKSNDLSMNRVVVDAKAELEKIREQFQNIE